MSPANDPGPDPLADALARWVAPSGLEGPAPAEVWRRIAVAESGSRDGWAVLLDLLSRPAWAFLFVAVCIVSGLLLAEVQVGREQKRANEQLARSYLQLIDPLLQNAPKEGTS